MSAAPILPLPDGNVDVWQISLANSITPMDEMRAVLSPNEVSRAERLVRIRDQQRFITARSTLRTIVGQYLGLAPQVVTFHYNPHGKPHIDPDLSSLRFNLSHSGDWAMCAVSAHTEVGIDIEKFRPQSAAYRRKLAQRFFSVQEHQAMQSIDDAGTNAAFFSGWTRKEAYIKCHGKGLTIPLSAFSVSIGYDAPPKLVQSSWQPGDAQHCRLYDLKAPAGYCAALAVLAPDLVRVQQLCWSS
jgi:4'-phosphopantetheinyl transferase